MPDIGHVAVGMLAGRWYAGEDAPRAETARAMAAFSAVSLLPDVDMTFRALGFPDHTALGHRGAFHSLAAAALFAAALVNGALDMLDTGALGVAYLWPFSNTHYFWPWRFLPGPPPGEHWLSLEGARAVALGAVYFVPVFVLALRPSPSEARPKVGIIPSL